VTASCRSLSDQVTTAILAPRRPHRRRQRRETAQQYVALLAGFLEEEPFRVGTRWAVWRLAMAPGAEVARLADDLMPSLADPTAAVRGHAALALRALRPDERLAALAPLTADEAPFSVFDHRVGLLRSVTVGAVAARPF
jgi:hypothetical protein